MNNYSRPNHNHRSHRQQNQALLNSISKKILKIYSDDTWSEKAQDLSRKNARDVFGLEAMLSETFRLYEEAMK